MSKILRLTLILIAFCTCMTAATWLTGHMQPLTSAILFTYPDSSPCTRPCAFGIRPGQSSKAEATALLRAHPLTRSLTRNLEGDIFHDAAVCVILNLDSEGRVASIQLAKRTNATAPVDGSVLDQLVFMVGVSGRIKEAESDLAVSAVGTG